MPLMARPSGAAISTRYGASDTVATKAGVAMVMTSSWLGALASASQGAAFMAGSTRTPRVIVQAPPARGGTASIGVRFSAMDAPSA